MGLQISAFNMKFISQKLDCFCTGIIHVFAAASRQHQEIWHILVDFEIKKSFLTSRKTDSSWGSCKGIFLAFHLGLLWKPKQDTCVGPSNLFSQRRTLHDPIFLQLNWNSHHFTKSHSAIYSFNFSFFFSPSIRFKREKLQFEEHCALSFESRHCDQYQIWFGFVWVIFFPH